MCDYVRPWTCPGSNVRMAAAVAARHLASEGQTTTSRSNLPSPRLVLKVKGRRGPVMFQKDPRDIYTALPRPPSPHVPFCPVKALFATASFCRKHYSNEVSVPFASISLSLSLSPSHPQPPLPLSSSSSSLAPAHPPLPPSLSFSLYLSASIKFPVTQWCRGYSSSLFFCPLSFPLRPSFHYQSGWNLSPHPHLILAAPWCLFAAASPLPSLSSPRPLHP